jgi:RHS repeat-associated protein
MQSGLVDANITNINNSTWTAGYSYKKDGNIEEKTVNSQPTDYEYDTTQGGSKFDSDIMTKAGNDDLTWNSNGQLAQTPAISFNYNWDGKLRKVYDANDDLIVSYKYDGLGNRICKNSAAGGNHRYILDLTGSGPKVLLVLDVGNNNAILKRYVHTDSEVLMQQDGSTALRYYYLHDRLGSVRLVIDDTGSVVNSYTYDPWGKAFESETQETVSNDYRFAGYFWDDEPRIYYCINRYYDPELMRFTARDPVKGKQEEPLMRHPYLYCINDSINRTDPKGRFGFMIGGELSFTGSEAADFVGDAMRAVTAFGFDNSPFDKALRVSMGILADQAYIMQAASNLFDKLDSGFSGSAATVFGYGNGKFYGGSCFSVAAGPAYNSSFTLGAVYAFSYNANKLDDWAGNYTEYGASCSWYGRGPGVFTYPGIGATFCRDMESGISVIGIGLEAGIEEGLEAHVFRGHSWVAEW